MRPYYSGAFRPGDLRPAIAIQLHLALVILACEALDADAHSLIVAAIPTIF